MLPTQSGLEGLLASCHIQAGLQEALRGVTRASTWQERERLLCQACLEAGEVHRRLSVPGNVQAVIILLKPGIIASSMLFSMSRRSGGRL